MGPAWSDRLVTAVLRCYPARWRRRHGDEAAELATLLMRDGTPARSIAWNYLTGAARAQLASPPVRRVGAAAGALLVAGGGLGVPLALSSSPPAGAASVIRSVTRSAAPGRARRMEELLRSGCLIGQPRPRAQSELRAARVRVTWHGTGFVATARATGPGVISLGLSAHRPAGHDHGC